MITISFCYTTDTCSYYVDKKRYLSQEKIVYSNTFDLKLGYNIFQLENTTSISRGSMVLVNITSTGRLALNDDGFYSDFYINQTGLFRLNEYKNQRFYLNVLTSKLFYQRLFSINYTYEYVGIKNLYANGLLRQINIVNCKFEFF